MMILNDSVRNVVLKSGFSNKGMLAKSDYNTTIFCSRSRSSTCRLGDKN